MFVLGSSGVSRADWPGRRGLPRSTACLSHSLRRGSLEPCHLQPRAQAPAEAAACAGRAGPARPACGAAVPAGCCSARRSTEMGQSPSKADARLQEIAPQLTEAYRRSATLWQEAEAEKAAGVLPSSGSKQALLQAARRHLAQLSSEHTELTHRWGGRCCRCCLPWLACCAHVAAILAHEWAASRAGLSSSGCVLCLHLRLQQRTGPASCMRQPMPAT